MSIIDEKMPELDPTIWYMRNGEYKLRPEVDGKIRKLAQRLLVGIRAHSAYIVGSITGFYYTPTSDIDVNVIVSVDAETKLALIENALKVNGKFAPGTKHPINFFIRNEKMNPTHFDGVFNLKTGKWVKTATEQGVDLFSIYDRFRDDFGRIDALAGEAWRSLLDINILRDVLRNGGSREVMSKLRRRVEILDDTIQELAETYDEAHRDRIAAFRRQLELADMGQNPYPSPDLVPENIRYKLLERYHYMDFMKRLYDLLRETEVIDTKRDIKDVRDIMSRQMAKKSLGESFLKPVVEKWGF